MRKIKVLNKQEFEDFCIEMLSKCRHGARAIYEIVSGNEFDILTHAGGIIYELTKGLPQNRISFVLVIKNNKIICDQSYLNGPKLKRWNISCDTHPKSFQKIVEKHFYEEIKPEEIWNRTIQ